MRVLHHKTVTKRKDNNNWIIGAPEVNLVYLQTIDRPGKRAIGSFDCCCYFTDNEIENERSSKNGRKASSGRREFNLCLDIYSGFLDTDLSVRDVEAFGEVSG